MPIYNRGGALVSAATLTESSSIHKPCDVTEGVRLQLIFDVPKIDMTAHTCYIPCHHNSNEIFICTDITLHLLFHIPLVDQVLICWSVSLTNPAFVCTTPSSSPNKTILATMNSKQLLCELTKKV